MESPRELSVLMPNKLSTRAVIELRLAMYAFASRYVKNRKTLDVACGSGYGANYLVSNASLVVGGDLSQDAVAYAKEHYKRDNLHFCILNAQSLPFADESFDAIVSNGTLEVVEKYEDFVTECRRVIKEDGLFICSTPNRLASLSLPPKLSPYRKYQVKAFSAGELRVLMQGQFKSVVIYGIQHLSMRSRLIRELIAVVSLRLPKRLKHLASKLAPWDYRLAKLEDYDKSQWDEICDLPSYAPFSLQHNSTPRFLVVVATPRSSSIVSYHRSILGLSARE